MHHFCHRPILELRSARAAYDSPRARRRGGPARVFGPSVAVFDDLSLSLDHGEITAVVGPSGCGKTTLLQCAAGLRPLVAGSCSFDGRPIAPVERDLAFMFQHNALLPWYTALGNVELPLRIRGLDRRGQRERALSELALLGVAGKAHSYPIALSGGERQRVALARTLVTRPRLILLDEPFSSVDEILRERLQELLRDLLDTSGAACLLVTHSVEEAVFLARRVYVMTPRGPTGAGRLHEVTSAPLPAAFSIDDHEAHSGLPLAGRRIESTCLDSAGTHRGGEYRFTTDFSSRCADVRRALRFLCGPREGNPVRGDPDSGEPPNSTRKPGGPARDEPIHRNLR